MLGVHGLIAGWTLPVTPPVDLAVARGEVVGIGGPNGVGKSTVLAAIAGTARVFAGRIERSPGVRLALQTQAAPPLDGLPLSGRELLALTGAAAGGLPPWLAGRLDERLDERLDRLSGGQRHYLALWAVLEAPADLVLLDEPTNHLDAAGSRHLASHLRQRAAAGAGVLLVSHDADFVAAACDRLVTLAATTPENRHGQ